MNTLNSPKTFTDDASMHPIGEPYSSQGSLAKAQVEAVTEPPPHQPDKAPTEKEEKNDQQQQEGIDPPHPKNAPFEEPDIAPD